MVNKSQQAHRTVQSWRIYLKTFGRGRLTLQSQRKYERPVQHHQEAIWQDQPARMTSEEQGR